MQADEAPERRECIGASEAPAIVGVDPFTSAGSIWARKTGRAPSTVAARGMTPAAVGSALGPLLVAYAADQLGREVGAQEVWYRHPEKPMSVTVDGLILNPPGVLIEAKTVGLLGPPPAYAAEYGEDGTDAVPRALLVQVHHAFAVLEAQPDLPAVREALAPVLIGGRGLHLYRIVRDDALVQDLRDLEAHWWQTYVVGDRCPPGEPPSLEILRHMERSPLGPPKPLDPVLVNEWLAAKEVAKQASTNEEHIRRAILTELGDGELGECPLGRVTYKAQQRGAYTVAAQTVRVLRFQPHRGVG